MSFFYNFSFSRDGNSEGNLKNSAQITVPSGYNEEIKPAFHSSRSSDVEKAFTVTEKEATSSAASAFHVPTANEAKDRETKKYPWMGFKGDSHPPSPATARSRKVFILLFFLALTITGIGLLIASFKKVGSTEYGVQYNVHKKQLQDAVKSGGLFIGPPGYKFIKFPSTFVTKDLNNGTCVSQDGLKINFDVTFQYQINKNNLTAAILKYRDFYKWANVVEAAGQSAVQHACSEFQTADFQAKRGIIQQSIEDNMRIKFEGDPATGREGIYAKIVSTQLRNVDLPKEYNDAVAAKQSAQQDIDLALNQRKQATTKAQTDYLTAQQEAIAMLESANNDADVILTEATLQAEGILFAYQLEAETIDNVKTSLNLTTNGILAFLGNKLVEEVPNLRVSAAEPARLSREAEL